MSSPPKAYSYIRFSTPEQQNGDSFRRQAELSQAYADLHGLILDERLTYRDLGVSAFDRSNVRAGQLGAFLKAVEDGLVPTGYQTCFLGFCGAATAKARWSLSTRDTTVRAANYWSAHMQKEAKTVCTCHGSIRFSRRACSPTVKAWTLRTFCS